MKRRVILFLLVVWMCSLTVSAYAAVAGDVLCVTNCESWVSLRQGAQRSSARIERLPKGSVVTFDSVAANGFYKVKYGNIDGYVLSQYLDEQNLAMRIGNCNRYVTMRERPSTKAKEIAKIDKDELVLYVSSAENGFFRVYYVGETGYGKTGYVLSKYLQGAALSDGTAQYVTNCQSFISHRSAPSTKASRFQKIPLNAKVISFGQAGNGMEYVYYKGKYGFAASKYLSSLPDADIPIKSATLYIHEEFGANMSQTVTDSASLRKLQDMLRKATPSDLGQCPINGYLTLKMEDGSIRSARRFR